MDYKLEKRIWTDADFDVMGWHDNKVYWTHLDKDLVLDIDYILQWIDYDTPANYSYVIAPATLVFKQPQGFRFGIDGNRYCLEILDITRKNTKKGTLWTITMVEGEFKFYSKGFVQYIRQDPFFEHGQSINFHERGGYCLDRTTNQDNPKRYSEDVLRRREKEAEQSRIAKQYEMLLNKKKALDLQREKGEIDFKPYLITSREYKRQLKEYQALLKGTWFEVDDNLI
ncbi:hypothetical protein CAP35_09415 [Chitinophagaceae bacterium IBVUCB1]|nr:hypothetical protein CAP35_09415 [Chitinophagaceae bacterium IBVUCB1]